MAMSGKSLVQSCTSEAASEHNKNGTCDERHHLGSQLCYPNVQSFGRLARAEPCFCTLMNISKSRDVFDHLHQSCLPTHTKQPCTQPTTFLLNRNMHRRHGVSVCLKCIHQVFRAVQVHCLPDLQLNAWIVSPSKHLLNTYKTLIEFVPMFAPQPLSS